MNPLSDASALDFDDVRRSLPVSEERSPQRAAGAAVSPQRVGRRRREESGGEVMRLAGLRALIQNTTDEDTAAVIPSSVNVSGLILENIIEEWHVNNGQVKENGNC